MAKFGVFLGPVMKLYYELRGALASSCQVGVFWDIAGEELAKGSLDVTEGGTARDGENDVAQLLVDVLGLNGEWKCEPFRR